jgi:hypothetical protein
VEHNRYDRTTLTGKAEEMEKSTEQANGVAKNRWRKPQERRVWRRRPRAAGKAKSPRLTVSQWEDHENTKTRKGYESGRGDWPSEHDAFDAERWGVEVHEESHTQARGFQVRANLGEVHIFQRFDGFEFNNDFPTIVLSFVLSCFRDPK